MTNEQINRTVEAKKQTQKMLDREMNYLPHLRNPSYIASLQTHMTKLNAMVSA